MTDHTPRTMKLKLTMELTVDAEGWAMDYGVSGDKIPADVASYLRYDAIPSDLLQVTKISASEVSK